MYLQHPCVILSALEVLGYQVVASSSTSVKQDYNEYMWTMRKDFSEPEPVPVPITAKPSESCYASLPVLSVLLCTNPDFVCRHLIILTTPFI